jgi:hypothetical protein
LGRFFAAKFRAGALHALYERSSHRPALEEAIQANRAARAAWSELAEQAKDVYVRDITFGFDSWLRGHWLDRLPAMDEDIADMENLLKQAPGAGATPPKTDRKVIEQAMRAVLAKPGHDKHPSLAGLHEPAPSFQRGQPLTIVAHVPNVSILAMISGLCLRYRHVNQAEIWRTIEMEHTGENYRAVIAADYTDSPFPLQYHFQIRTVSDQAWLHPGLEHPWHGQPYFFVRRA